MQTKFLALQEVADELGVDVQTVRRWIKSGRLRAFRPGKEYRIRESDLEEFLRDREVRPKGAASPSNQASFNDVLEEERRTQSLEEVKERFAPLADGLSRYCARWEGVAQPGAANTPEEVADFFSDLRDLRDLIGHAYTSELYAIANALGVADHGGGQVVGLGMSEETVTSNVGAMLHEHSVMRPALQRYYAVGFALAESIGDEETAETMQRMEQAITAA